MAAAAAKHKIFSADFTTTGPNDRAQKTERIGASTVIGRGGGGFNPAGPGLPTN
jgi:hypothetical protein